MTENMMTDETLEQVKRNYEKFRNLCALLGDRSEAVLKMVDELGDRLAMCPASSKTSYHNAMCGGLVEHSLRVLSYAKKLNETLKLDVNKESLIISCLMHDLGKVGDLDQERYLPQDNSYYYQRGNVYRINEDLTLRTTDTTLFLLQHYGVALTEDEFMAIKLADGRYDRANESYGLDIPDIAMLVHHADVWATKQEKKLARTAL